MEQDIDIIKAKMHKPILILSKNAQRKVHGGSRIGQFNMHLAVLITKAVGSMWCAYMFAILALISLPAAITSHDPLIIIAWIAQTFLQLVLLPIIIVGQNVQAEASDERAKHDHETLMAIHKLSTEIYELNENQTKILELLKEKKQ